MHPTDIPVLLPSLSEVLDLELYPLVRYIPPCAEIQGQPDCENSELLDHEIESQNARCEICHDKYISPKTKHTDTTRTEECEPLRKLPYEHAYHLRISVYFLGRMATFIHGIFQQSCIESWLFSNTECSTCHRQVIDPDRISESAQMLLCVEGHEGVVYSLVVSPDGRRRTVLRGHRHGVSSVVFSPSGLYVVSGSRDGTIRIWSLESGRAASASLNGKNGGVSCIVFSADGNQLVTSSFGGHLQI